MEAMSLMEQKKMSYNASYPDSLYVDACFKDTPHFWTADPYAWTDNGDVSSAWGLNFGAGYCVSGSVENIYGDPFVRAVRSGR